MDSGLDHIGLSDHILNGVWVLRLVLLLWLLDVLIAHVLKLTEELASILWHWLLSLSLWLLIQILLLVVLVAHVLQLADELATGGPVILQLFLNVVVVVVGILA